MTTAARIVASTQGCWSAAFARRDIPGLISVSTEDVLFYGSKAELFRGHDGVRRYFTGLSPMFKRTQFADPVVTLLTSVFSPASGPVLFEAEDAGSRRLLPYQDDPHRPNGWRLARRGAAWECQEHGRAYGGHE